MPTQSTTEFDFLDNLYQDIIDAVCDTLDAIAEASTQVSNISLNHSSFGWYYGLVIPDWIAAEYRSKAYIQ